MHYFCASSNLIELEQTKEQIILRYTGDTPEEQWTEIIAARSLGDDVYEIHASPFQAYSISYLDKVKTDGEFKGLPLFKEIIEKSGHSTYRVIAFNEITHPLFGQFWQPLADLGCTYEAANSKLITVNVPPSANAEEVFRMLENGEKFKLWDFEEADIPSKDQ